MSKFIIEGPQKLSGKIDVYGAKNAAMKMIAASILVSDEVVLQNVPKILDVEKLAEILIKMGATIERQGHQLKINTANLRPENPDPELVRAIRASVVLIGPLLSRFNKVSIAHPGGDKIGSRPIDRHIKAFRDLGVQVEEKGDSYTFSRGLKLNSNVKFDQITWTGTENILIFASGLLQETTIENIALEPEVLDLIAFLKKMGVQIELKNRTAKVTGTNKFKPLSHRCIADRLEAATFAVMAAATGSGIEIINCPTEHLAALWQKFNEMGIKFVKNKKSVYIEKPEAIATTNISTAEYPGFVTDMQPPMGLLLTQANGTSRVTENLFENRLGYLKELQKMGAKVELLNLREAKIFGPTALTGTHLQSLDLRAGATLIIAGLMASGRTIIENAENIDRGYEKIEERLAKVGAKITRVN